MGRRHSLLGSIGYILHHNRDGSGRTQGDRKKSLNLMMNELYDAGYQLDHAKFIKQKHVKYLVNKWQENELSPGTLKNRMSHLRWLCQKVNKPNLVPTNDELGIPKRIYVSNIDKSTDITEEQLTGLENEYAERNLRGQKLFGLRMEESMKILPHVADQGDMLFIYRTWSKGGRDRYIPITTEEQRDWLNDCKSFVKYKSNSLIPMDTSYNRYRKRFEKHCERHGIHRRHGLRHLYAQTLYKKLTGWECPVKGGPSKENMTQEQREIDRNARLEISKALGHNRVQVTSQYIS